MKNLIYTLSILFLVSSCSSIEKLVEKGKYDKAFSLAVKKLQGKKKKKTKYVQGLETAFKKLNERDLRSVSNLIDKNNSKYWKEIFSIYNKINSRQVSLDPLLPLISKDGYRAQFDFIKKGFYTTEHVKGLELSFEKLTSRDLNKVTNLIATDNQKVWPKIFEIYQDINNRQSILELKLPLRSADGYQADFRFINTGTLEKEAAKNASTFLYTKGINEIRLARNGNKKEAKNAYNTLRSINKYYDNYKDTNTLIQEAFQLGQTRILVQFKNNSASILPLRFESNLFSFGVKSLNTRWQKFYNKVDRNIDYDIIATYSIRFIDASPEREIINHIVESKEISDGWDYVLDSNGNVMKDTSGNDLKIERFKTITAEVANVIMEKSVGIDGNLIITDANNKESLFNKMISGEAVFDEHFSTFRGDKNALSKDTRRRLKSHPIFFPSDEEMLLLTANELKRELDLELRRFF